MMDFAVEMMDFAFLMMSLGRPGASPQELWNIIKVTSNPPFNLLNLSMKLIIMGLFRTEFCPTF